MEDSEFAKEVEEILNYIAEVVEANDPESEFEIDIRDGILHLITTCGVFVINKQSAVKEIWLSSPLSGPYHFAKKDSSWCSRNGAQLYEILSKELNINFKNSQK